MLRMDHYSQLSLLTLLKDNLTNPSLPIQDNYIICLQLQTLEKIANQLSLGIENPIWKAIELFLTILYQHVIGHTAVFVVETALVEGCGVIMGCKVLAGIADIGEIILANQSPPRDILHMLHKVLIFMSQIASDKLIILRIEIADNLALSLRAFRLTCDLSQHLVQRNRRRCNLDISKIVIKPDNFLIQKTNIFRQMLDIIR